MKTKCFARKHIQYVDFNTHSMDKKSMLDALIAHYTSGNKAKFATLLGVSAQTISAWGTRNTFDSELIYTKCIDISPDWLLTGEGPMLRADDTPAISATIATDISARGAMYSDAVTLRLMEKIDEKDAKIDQLQSELRQQAAELAAFKARYPNTVAARPEGLDPAKHASIKKHSSPPDADNATSANAQ